MFGLQHTKNLLHSNLEEINQDVTLKKYGFYLSWIHFFTFAYWFLHTKAYTFIADPSTAVCQPFFSWCRSIRFLTPETWRWILVAYFIAGLIGIGLWRRTNIKAAYYMSFALIAFKFAIYAQDYRMMGNYHYIHYLLLGIFLLIPNKRSLLPAFIVLIYLGAGILKLNFEWLSGAALFGDIGVLEVIPLEWATAYVVILELCFSWLLLSQNKKIRLFALAQFLLFHFYSIQIVGLFYPAVMASVLSIFFLTWNTPPNPQQLLQLFKTRSSQILIGAFCIAQLYPLLLPGNPALTSEGRLFSLNMFDAKADCRHSYLVEGIGETYEKNFDFSNIGPRIKCDPIVYIEIAKNLCAMNSDKSGVKAKLHLDLQSKLSSDREFHPRVRIDNICENMPSYSIFTLNDWIQK